MNELVFEYIVNAKNIINSIFLVIKRIENTITSYSRFSNNIVSFTVISALMRCYRNLTLGKIGNIGFVIHCFT